MTVTPIPGTGALQRGFVASHTDEIIAPDLETKRDIIPYAIDLAHALGISAPKVAVLSAVETVKPAIRSTVDAAALAVMVIAYASTPPKHSPG